MLIQAELLNNLILRNATRILALLDKNPFSVTFGCFDRKYWQYKIIDFPCGMQQELILPLSYLWKTPFEGNQYFRQERIRDFIEGIFRFHAKCSNSDGSLDDYFPHERAFGASSYALAALTEGALLTGICPPEVIPSLERTGKFLANYCESGVLSNHYSIASLALINLFRLTGESVWKKRSFRKVAELAKKQHEEGWFIEYEGCDPGYQTVTIEFLARLFIKEPSEEIFQMLKRCILFLREFVHPDGSLGGEYGSRNTYNFYPGGFALLSSRVTSSAEILGYFFKGLENGTCNFLEDDGVLGHQLSSYVTVLTCNDTKIQVPKIEQASNDIEIKRFSGSGFFKGKTGNLRLFGSFTKGGVYKIFQNNKLLFSDTGFVGELKNGVVFCQNKPNNAQGIFEKNQIKISGKFQIFKNRRLGKIEMAGLRVLSLLFGWIKSYSNIIRSLMQKVIIFHREEINLFFRRVISIHPTEIVVTDLVENRGNSGLVSLYRSSDCVNTHVVTSDSFQIANLQPWENIKIDCEGNEFTLEKRFSNSK